MNGIQLVQQLLNKAIHIDLLNVDDEIYVRNQMMGLLQIKQMEPSSRVDSEEDLPDVLEKLVDYACAEGIIEDFFDEREIFASKLMNTMLPMPSHVNEIFYGKYQKSPKAATDYFYQFSQNSNYIQTKRIDKNVQYQVPTEYGEMDITINLSKPEKDPRQIALERKQGKSETGYPTCLLCLENEGYPGRIGHPARSNHRLIKVDVPRETWYLQYSPYVYYNEHCILLCEEHRDMKISRETFERLLAFVEQFPHYFIGSNSDIPIVGGSILTHDHYQGGHYEFAMAKAEEEYAFTWSSFPHMECSLLRWPMSVIRIRSSEKDELVQAAELILQAWKQYSDPELAIYAETFGNRHNAITPIARSRNGQYELDLVLRNNRTSEEHPMGIFHPHAEVHHIKKENIGLIEVMGLAVLPARLNEELQAVGNYLLDESKDIAEYHREWADQLKVLYHNQLSRKTVDEIIQKEVGKKFLQTLEDAGVFKRDQEGRQGFQEFIKFLTKIEVKEG